MTRYIMHLVEQDEQRLALMQARHANP
jgi:hypothetical protein